MAVRMACQLRDEKTKGDRHDDGSHPLPSNYRAYRHSVQARLVQILRQNAGCRFLEIGVGPTLRQERFRAIDELGIHYVGLDFEHVCAERRADLAAAGIADRNITFLGNPSGTYLFNLIKLARKRETFDHHLSRWEPFDLCRSGGCGRSSTAIEVWCSVPFR